MGKLKLKVLVGIGAALVLIVGAIFLMNISYDNKDQRLRADFADQERKIEINFDTMWKTVSGKVQVLEKYSADFKEVCKGWVQGRYGDNGSQATFQWLKEHNIAIDAEMYKEVSITIEATRKSFEREQRRLSEIGAAHQKMFVTAPSKWFLSGEPVEVKVISSGKTKKVMQTGEENDVNIFGK